MKEILKAIKKDLINTSEKLATLSENDASVIPAPGKWCIKEILGHLIDSAINNHRRFILMHSSDTLIFDDYQQDEWVRLSAYKKREFVKIIETWQMLNSHLVDTLQNFDTSFWNREYKVHGLNKSYWKVHPLDKPATPILFAKDYFAHQTHHFKQIEQISGLRFNFGDILFK